MLLRQPDGEVLFFENFDDQEAFDKLEIKSDQYNDQLDHICEDLDPLSRRALSLTVTATLEVRRCRKHASLGG